MSALFRDQRGFTLGELLITIAVLGMIMAAVLGVQMTSNTMFLRGENQAESQQAARAAMLLEEDLRMAGYGCPALGCTAPGTTAANCPAPAAGQLVINAANASCLDFWADAVNASTTLSAAAAAGATTLTVASTTAISIGNTVYLVNGNTWESKAVTATTATTLTVGALTNAYPQGVLVGRPRRIVYAINTATGTLTKDAGDGNGAQTLATGVTGLTFSYFNTAADAAITIAAGTPPAVSAANLLLIGRVQIQTTTQSALAATGGGGFGSFQINSNVRPRNLCIQGC
jgi:prepilin-type N-terminal cleavage/methylation domain-containing protein